MPEGHGGKKEQEEQTVKEKGLVVGMQSRWERRKSLELLKQAGQV